MGICLNAKRVVISTGAHHEETSNGSSSSSSEADQKMDQMQLPSPPKKSDEERIKSRGEVGAKKVRTKVVDAQEEEEEEEEEEEINKKGGADCGGSAGGGGGSVRFRNVVTQEELKWILACNKKDLKCSSVEELLNMMKVRSRNIINEEDRVIGRKGRRRRGWKPVLDSITEEPHLFN